MAKSTESVTNIFRILADPVRRYVLDYLDEQEAPVTFARLTARVAAWRTDCVSMGPGNESPVSARSVPGGWDTWNTQKV